MGGSRFNRAIVATFVLALLTAAGALWWKCTRSEGIAFLPTRAGAEWIIYPRGGEGGTRDTIPVTAQFRHTFTVTALPANATLTVCAFKGAAVAINGREVGNILHPGRNWKLPARAEVAGLLRLGTNEITAWVTNSVGPPALWLRLMGTRLSLGTSEHWQVSLTGTDWQSAWHARRPIEFQEDNSLHRSTRIAALNVDLLKSVWPVEAVFCALSLALVGVTNYWLRRKRSPGTSLPTTTSTKQIYGLLVIVLMARAALFINNVPQLPRSMGFDAADHEQYVRFIQEKHALPLANDGWEMFQPPLYYMASALVLSGCGRSVGDEDAVYFLRAVNGVIGLLHCWVALLCLRLLFPKNLPAQAAGLLIAAFLPPTLYLSQYVTNEPLAGFLVTVAIYFCLRELRAEKGGLWLPVGIGVALGAAMLTKFSVLLALPCILLALSQRLVSGKQHAHRDWLRSMGAVVAGCVIVCGWHYGRVWARFGTPIVGNWDTQAGRSWWQDPGFRTIAFYTSFGRVLISPLCSAFHSFADGIYSTLWGDGLVSGGLPPPWNYDLMFAGYWLSLGISIAVIIGAALTLARLMRRIRGKWLLVVSIVCIYSLGLLWMSLRVPSYAQAKAFYALPALLPFSALAAVGWDWLRRWHRAVGTAVWVLLLFWCMTVYTTFWVRRGNPMTHLLQGAYLAQKGHYAEAVQSYSIAVRLKPDDAEAHYNLGVVLGEKDQADEAIGQFKEAVRLRPDYAEAHFAVGSALLNKGQTAEAISQFQQAIRLKPDFAEAHCNLGAALLNKGQIDKAISQFQEALHLKPDFADAHNGFGIALVRKGQIDKAISQFHEAIRLKPDDAKPRNNLRQALLKKSQLDEAIRQFQEAIILKPDDAEVHYDLGTTLLNKGQIDQAISQFEEAVRLKPDYAKAHNNLGIAFGSKGQVDQAISQLQEAIHLKPDDAEAHYNLGTALGMKGQRDDALGQFKEAIQLKPDYADAHNNLGAAFLEKGQIDEAISQFHEAIRLKPDYDEARSNLQNALLKKRQTDGGIR